MKIFLLLCLLAESSCGKSPLSLKKPNEEIPGQNKFESAKTFQSTGQQIDLTWLSPLNSTDTGHFLLIAKKNNVVSDLPIGFTVFLWMPSMGHGSSPVTVKKLGTGIYDISDVYFIMDGEWQIRIQLKNNGTMLEELNFTYNI